MNQSNIRKEICLSPEFQHGYIGKSQIQLDDRFWSPQQYLQHQKNLAKHATCKTKAS